MKVKELIKLLEVLEQEKEIVIMDSEGPCFDVEINKRVSAYNKEYDKLEEAYFVSLK